jgi:hypothetical protein
VPNVRLCVLPNRMRMLARCVAEIIDRYGSRPIMPDLSYLTTGELSTAETAAETLMNLHDKHQVLDRDLYVRLGTLLADVHMVQEDHLSRQPVTSSERTYWQ